MALKDPTSLASAESATSSISMQQFPLESVPNLLHFADARSIAAFRGALRLLGGLGHETRLTMLRARVLTLLTRTKFPFTHAAYVLGLNGSYYSYDTAAENHYGIPAQLTPLICELFRAEVPDGVFTTIRLQKLTALANFGGKHRTLAFSLGLPTLDSQPGENQRADASCMDITQDQSFDASDAKGFALCLTPGCTGGYGDVREDLMKGSWQLLTRPFLSSDPGARWTPFSRSSWLQWHWPTAGDIYAIIITCEPSVHRNKLTLAERRFMLKAGFRFPHCDDADASDIHVNGAPNDMGGERQDASALPQRRSMAAVITATRVLGLEGVATLTLDAVEQAFRRAVRAVHPDSADGILEIEDFRLTGSHSRGWAMSQLSWARRVLRDAVEAEMSFGNLEEEGANVSESSTPLLMLGPPMP